MARSGVRVLAAMGVLALLAAGCAPKPRISPAVLACTAAAPTARVLAQRVSACSGLIATAKGDDLRMALRARGTAYRQQANYTAALRDFNQALALKGDDASAFDGRGLVFKDQGDLARARADIEQAIRLDPNAPAGYNNRSIVERRQGDLASALRDANRAIELSPGNANPWAERGLVYLAKRQFELAVADFADAVKIDPTLAFAWDGEGDAERGKGDVADALRDYNQASTAYFNTEYYRRAIGESDKAVALKPDDAESLNNRCWTRGVADIELDTALADCQRSLQVRPGDADTLDSLAFVHFRRGDFQVAIDGYTAALARNPKLAASMFMRGVSKLRAGDADGGQADIDAAEQLDSAVAGEFASYGVTADTGGK